MLTWPHDGKRYDAGYFIGSQREDGSHSRSTSHWPFSIYRRANEIGVTDVVLCDGIQSHSDAKNLAEMLNAKEGLDRKREALT